MSFKDASFKKLFSFNIVLPKNHTNLFKLPLASAGSAPRLVPAHAVNIVAAHAVNSIRTGR